MGLNYLEESGFYTMNRDTPSWLLKKGELYNAVNLLFDRPGIVRMRAPWAALSAVGAQTAFCQSIGFAYANDASNTEELYGLDAKAGPLYSINKTTGVPTSLVTGVPGTSVVGRAVNHFGFLHFPCDIGVGGRKSAVVAGQTTVSNFTNAVVAQCTANNQQITLTGADVTTNIKVGALVSIITATRRHNARVVSIDTAKLFTIWPMVPFTDAAIPIGGVTTTAATVISGGLCAASFQNRLLYGNCIDLASVGQTLIADRRIYYSPLPTEVVTNTGGLLCSGAQWNDTSVWPTYNFIEVPDGKIVAMEPVNDNELLILTTTRVVVFRGNLVTQLSTTSQQVTFDVTQENVNAGCLSDHSVQRTSRGIMWAGHDGVFLYDGRSEAYNVLDGKMATYWRTLVATAQFRIHGSFYTRGHYYICGATNAGNWAIFCSLQNKEIAFSLASNLDIFAAVPRPSTPSQVYAAKYWDISGAAPVNTNGQCLRVESMFDYSGPTFAGLYGADPDGVFYGWSLTTRTIGGDKETQKIQARCTIRTQAWIQSAASQGPPVLCSTRIDVADTAPTAVSYVSVGRLSGNQPDVLSNATNATPIVLTTNNIASGLQVGDFVDVQGVVGNTAANGRWRVAAASGFNVTLQGSSGNGAYVSGGLIKPVTEKDFLTAGLEQGQGISFSITEANSICFFFELHGIRVAFYEREQVMSG